MCVQRNGMTTYVHLPSRVLSHIYYINSDIRRHYLIYGYGIFPSLRCAMSYPWTMSTYDLCIFLIVTSSPHCGETFLYHLPLSPRCILSCLFLYPRWIRLFSLLYLCWTRFILGLTKPYFQHAPWLRLVPSEVYLLVSMLR